tara:strand:- start:52 stop:198 length:147 start_codon:yes stop_codon:yes gene_type:complete
MPTLLEEYINQLDDKEREVYVIAKEHLESSFSLEKSIGYLKWLKEKKK